MEDLTTISVRTKTAERLKKLKSLLEKRLTDKGGVAVQIKTSDLLDKLLDLAEKHEKEVE